MDRRSRVLIPWLGRLQKTLKASSKTGISCLRCTSRQRAAFWKSCRRPIGMSRVARTRSSMFPDPKSSPSLRSTSPNIIRLWRMWPSPASLSKSPADGGTVSAEVKMGLASPISVAGHRIAPFLTPHPRLVRLAGVPCFATAPAGDGPVLPAPVRYRPGT